MITFFYIFQNLYLISIIHKKINQNSNKILIPFLISFIIILLLAKPSNDILSYTKQIISPHQFELLFAYNIIILKDVFSLKPELIISIIQYEFLFLFLLLIHTFADKKNFYLILIISICSVFFYLSFFNNLRQAFSLIFFAFCFLFYFKKNYIFSFLSLLIGFFFHKTIIFFFLYTLFFGAICKVFRKKEKKIISLNDHLLILIILCIIYSILFIFFKVEFSEIQYFNYLDKKILDTNRTPIFYKLMLMFLVYFISEIMLKNVKLVSSIFQQLRFLRTSVVALLIFPLLLLIYSNENLNLIDFTSRILFFYFFVELAFVCELIKNNKGKNTVIFLIFSHLFAINVYKIIL